MRQSVDTTGALAIYVILELYLISEMGRLSEIALNRNEPHSYTDQFWALRLDIANNDGIIANRIMYIVYKYRKLQLWLALVSLCLCDHVHLVSTRSQREDRSPFVITIGKQS